MGGKGVYWHRVYDSDEKHLMAKAKQGLHNTGYMIIESDDTLAFYITPPTSGAG